MNKINTKKGFTIIEVVLVLAIAGLIFLMVFIALPALQRNQRDTQRKNDLSRVQSAINSFQANNRGRIPNETEINGAFTTGYMRTGGDQFQDPSGRNYTFVHSTGVPAGATTWANDGNVTIQYAVGTTCNGETITGGQGANKVSLRMALEGGGQYCLNN